MDIDKIAQIAYKHIEPYWSKIEDDYKKRSNELNQLLSKDHTLIGLVLKVHLIVEYYINQCLERNFQNTDLEGARLTFNQKIALLPKSETGARWLLPGIKELNKIRNKIAHNIHTEVLYKDFPEIIRIVKVSRETSHGEVEKLLNDFAIISGSFLGNSEPEIVKVFSDAFKQAYDEIKK